MTSSPHRPEVLGCVPVLLEDSTSAAARRDSGGAPSPCGRRWPPASAGVGRGSPSPCGKGVPRAARIGSAPALAGAETFGGRGRWSAGNGTLRTILPGEMDAPSSPRYRKNPPATASRAECPASSAHWVRRNRVPGEGSGEAASPRTMDRGTRRRDQTCWRRRGGDVRTPTAAVRGA